GAANTIVVKATISNGSGFSASCTGTTDAGGNWTCSAPNSGNIAVPADGSYTVSAQVTEKNGAFSPAGTANSFTVNTKATLTAPTGGVTNNQKPTFGGNKIGDGTEVIVCIQGQTCTDASNVCKKTGLATTKNIAWT